MSDTTLPAQTTNTASVRRLPNTFDLAAFAFIAAGLIVVAHAARHTFAPLEVPTSAPIHLDPSYLPGYALRTVMRMFAALACSLLFTLVYATFAAKSRRAGMVLIPILDILQSLPIFGFLTFTVTFFLGLFPGQVIGAELAVVFVIFTSQAWNMAFSMYQSLTTVPGDLDEATRVFRPLGLAAFLAPGGAIRHPRPDLEHDDVHVRRLVHAGGLRGGDGGQHLVPVAGHRQLHRNGARGEGHPCRALRHPRHARRHPRL